LFAISVIQLSIFLFGLKLTFFFGLSVFDLQCRFYACLYALLAIAAKVSLCKASPMLVLLRLQIPWL